MPGVLNITKKIALSRRILLYIEDMKRWMILLAGWVAVAAADAAVFRDRYSPWNEKRPVRAQTRYIILHTTEGPDKGSLEQLYRQGEAHYMVATDGVIYRVIQHRKVALHCGRSLWDGRYNLDLVSIGIEVSGYHNRPITRAQIAALKALLAELKKTYAIPDERVLCHSMVAYGTPNRWHARSHRGRKRCGMQFASRTLRRQLGLFAQPLHDPDVRAGRLVVGDPYLAQVLYGNAAEQEKAAERYAGAGANLIGQGKSAWDIAGDAYNRPSTRYVFPDGREFRGDQVPDWKKIPPGTRVLTASSDSETTEAEPLRLLGRHGSAKEIAGEEAHSATTFYFPSGGPARRGDQADAAALAALTNGTAVLVGYVHGGRITARQSAFDLCGVRWNHPATYYRFPDGTLTPGHRINENKIPAGTDIYVAQ